MSWQSGRKNNETQRKYETLEMRYETQNENKIRKQVGPR